MTLHLAPAGAEAIDRLDALLRQRLEAARDGRQTGRRLGVEHEYGVFEDGCQVDFRNVIHSSAIEGARLHPTNPDLYLTPSGIALMADGVVAEAASPPERLRPRFAAALDGWAARGRRQIEALMPLSMEVLPGSTHISVEVEPAHNDDLCRLFTQTFAPGLMLLMDNKDSPGMLVRPRPRRAELCGEYVDGVRLRAAAAFAAGGVIALEQRLKGEVGGTALPPLVDVTVEPGRQRYGWYVDRRAFGPDLYVEGRNAGLRYRRGRISAQEQLEAGWEVARRALRGVATRADLAAADAVIPGRLPLPCEQRDFEEPSFPAETPANPYAGLKPVERDGLRLEPVAATWDFVAYKVAGSGRQAVISVPEAQLGPFTRLAEAGRLDDLFERYLSVAPAGRTLTSYRQAAMPAFFDSVAPSGALLPPDRFGIGAGIAIPSRPGKVYLPPPPERKKFGIPWWPIALVTAVAIGFGVVTQTGGDDTQVAPPTAVAQAPATQPVVAPPTATQPAVAPPTQPPPAPPTQVPGLIVGPIVATLNTPVTTYSIAPPQNAAGRQITYTWTMVADSGEECGIKLPADYATAALNRTDVVWSHANTAPDNCRHEAPDHPFTVTVTVSDGVTPPVVRTYRGSNSGVGPVP